jgi:HEAT repeat protein
MQPRPCPRRTTLVPAAFALVAALAGAQQGYYFGPDTAANTGVRRDQPNTGRMPGATLGYVPTADTEPARWETWWAMNREEFLPSGGIAEDRGPYPPPGVPITPDETKARIVPALLKALKHRDADVRAAAAVALGKCGGETEIAALKEALGDKSRAAVEGALLGLGLLRLPAAEAPLAAYAADEKEPAKLRAFALVALGLSGGDTARKTLFDRLVGEGAAKAASGRETAGLESARAFAAGLWAAADRAGGDAANSALAAGQLAKALDAPPTRDREFVQIGTAALAKPRDAGSLPRIMAALLDRRSELRGAAAIAAGRVIKADDAASVKKLADFVGRESDRFARRMGVVALGRIGGPTAIAALNALPASLDRQDRCFQFLALGIAKDQKAIPALRDVFATGGDQSLRGAAAIALGLLADREYMPTLVKHATTQKDPQLLSHLMWAFAAARERSAAEAIERVHGQARDFDLRSSSALALGYLGYSQAEGALLAQLQDGGSKIVRGAAATALGRLGDARLIDPLTKLVEGEKETDLTRVAAVVALGVLGRRDRVPELSRLMQDALHAVRHEALDTVRDFL